MTSMNNTPPDYSAARGRALVFDSGVGGLTVVEALKDLCPSVRIDYAADSGFFPYGDKSDEALRTRLPEVASTLVDYLQPDVLVIACNTASTLALPEVRERLAIPVVGTVPAVKPAARLSHTGTIGLLATPGTIRRSYTAALINDFAENVDVHLHGSLELVSLAEAVAQGGAPPLEAFAAAQKPLFDLDTKEAMDLIVLACTHFPLVKNQLEASAPRPVTYIDSGAAIARQTARILSSNAASRHDDRTSFAAITSNRSDHPGLVQTFARFGFPETVEIEHPATGRSVAPVSSARIS